VILGVLAERVDDELLLGAVSGVCSITGNTLFLGATALAEVEAVGVCSIIGLDGITGNGVSHGMTLLPEAEVIGDRTIDGIIGSRVSHGMNVLAEFEAVRVCSINDDKSLQAELEAIGVFPIPGTKPPRGATVFEEFEAVAVAENSPDWRVREVKRSPTLSCRSRLSKRSPGMVIHVHVHACRPMPLKRVFT
jgi:hypothetical protein